MVVGNKIRICFDCLMNSILDSPIFEELIKIGLFSMGKSKTDPPRETGRAREMVSRQPVFVKLNKFLT